MFQSAWKSFTRIFPTPGTVDRYEKMRACAGALFGLVLTGLCSYFVLGKDIHAAWLIAPMGASSVLLFAVPASPLAQPWSIMGGNILAAIIGVTCAKIIDEPILAAGIAAALAIAAMFAARCIHPPSGAVALTAVLGGPAVHAMGYHFVLIPVALNSALLLITALFYNNATGRRYPHRPLPPDNANKHNTKDVAPTERIGIAPADLDAVLTRYNQVLDISRDDLEAIMLQTEMQPIAAASAKPFARPSCPRMSSRPNSAPRWQKHGPPCSNMTSPHYRSSTVVAMSSASSQKPTSSSMLKSNHTKA